MCGPHLGLTLGISRGETGQSAPIFLLIPLTKNSKHNNVFRQRRSSLPSLSEGLHHAWRPTRPLWVMPGSGACRAGALSSGYVPLLCLPLSGREAAARGRSPRSSQLVMYLGVELRSVSREWRRWWLTPPQCCDSSLCLAAAGHDVSRSCSDPSWPPSHETAAEFFCFLFVLFSI